MTGLLGAGYTGSYIFSQTLFAMRAGVATRLHSWIIAGMELGMFALPFSVRVANVGPQILKICSLLVLLEQRTCGVYGDGRASLCVGPNRSFSTFRTSFSLRC